MRLSAAFFFLALTGCYESRVEVTLRDPADVEVRSPSARDAPWSPPSQIGRPRAADDVTRAIDESTIATPAATSFRVVNDRDESTKVFVYAYPNGTMRVTPPGTELVAAGGHVSLPFRDTRQVTVDANAVRVDVRLAGRGKGARQYGYVDLRIPLRNVERAAIVRIPDRDTGPVLLGDSVALAGVTTLFAAGTFTDDAGVRIGGASAFGALAIAALVSGLWLVCASDQREEIVR